MSGRINGLKAGELDVATDIPPDQFKDISRNGDLEVVGGAVQNIRYLAIDATGPVLKDPRIRRAMSLALDRKLFVDTLWDGRVPVPNGFQMESFGDGYIKDAPALAYDPGKARALLKEAGYKGETISYRLLNNYYTNQVSGAQIMVEMWRAVGLNVEIRMMENNSQVSAKPINAIFDSSMTAIFPDYLGQAWRGFGPNGTSPSIGIWANQEHFDLGAKLQRTYDASERRKLIARMLEIIDQEDPAAIILHVSGQFYGKRKDVPWVPGQTVDMNFGPFNAAFKGK